MPSDFQTDDEERTRVKKYRCTFLVNDPETNEQVECDHIEPNWYEMKRHLSLKHDAGEFFNQFSTPISVSNGEKDE